MNWYTATKVNQFFVTLGGIGNASVSTIPGATNQPIDNLTQQFDQISLQQPSTCKLFLMSAFYV